MTTMIIMIVNNNDDMICGICTRVLLIVNVQENTTFEHAWKKYSSIINILINNNCKNKNKVVMTSDSDYGRENGNYNN